MLSPFEKAIISRLKFRCPVCQKYLITSELLVVEYPDHLEIYCERDYKGYNPPCFLQILRFPTLDKHLGIYRTLDNKLVLI